MALGTLGIGLGALAVLVIAWYVRSDEPDATTEVAAILAFLLGALAWQRPELAVPVGVVVGCCSRRNGRCTASPPRS